MTTAFAILVLSLSLVAWLGQLISAVSPRLAARLTLTESPDEVDPTFYGDVRAECIWDVFTLWILAAAALLMLLSQPSWTLFGLAGGGIYVYFAGRGIAQRLILRHRGVTVGKPATVLQAYVFLAIWGLVGAATVAWAGHDLLKGV
jgi:hypothetical protein